MRGPVRPYRLDRDVRGGGRTVLARLFRHADAAVAPGGPRLVQTIVIADDLFDRYRRRPDFIQQYIFPGGMLPGPAPSSPQAARAGLQIVDAFRFGADYAETLRRWRVRFLAQEAAVRRLRFDARFMRIWEFYLAYCEAAFTTGNVDVMPSSLLEKV